MNQSIINMCLLSFWNPEAIDISDTQRTGTERDRAFFLLLEVAPCPGVRRGGATAGWIA